MIDILTHMQTNFRKDEDGNTLILKSYKVKRLKELTTEINKLEHERNKIEHKIHDLNHWRNKVKSYKTFN